MSSQLCTSLLARVLLALVLLQAEAQWMHDGVSHSSLNTRVNPWQSRDSHTNTQLALSRLRSSSDSEEDTTDIVGTTIRGQDQLDVTVQEILVERSSQEVINSDEETQSQMENTTSSTNHRMVTREKKPIGRTSKVESNIPALGQARNMLGAVLPPVPVGPFHNPLGPAPQPIETSTRAWTRPQIGQAPGSLPPSVPQALAPAPPFGPPAPPTSESSVLPQPGGGQDGVLPPAIPLPPTSTSDATEITDIQCRNNAGGAESLSAVLSLPTGFEAVPVFEDAPTVDATTNPSCRMIPTQLVGMFQLFVSNFKHCGVAECQSGGEMLLCLVLRFPLMTGIKLPEDTIIEIRCRPQEKTAEDNSIVRVATAKYADRKPLHESMTPSIFEGGGHQFECKIEIYTKYKGTESFQQKIGDNEEVDLGEEIQLRSEVRSGDGWEYSRMIEVVLQRVGGARVRSSFNTIVLVFSDGCRNPEYQVIAKNHPQRDRNALIVNFNFRVFMFQDMIPGDSLMISAKVIGCVDEADCQPRSCADDKNFGFGKRRRRSTKEMTITKEIETSELLSLSPPPGTRPKRSTVDVDPKPHGGTTDWDRSFGIRVRFPDDHSSPLVQESIETMECRSYLFITMGVATFFCFITFIFALVLFYRSRPKVIPAHIPPQIIDSEFKGTALPPSVSNNGMLKEGYIQEATVPSPNTGAVDSLERKELQPSYINNLTLASPVRQRTRELEHNTSNANENTDPIPQVEDNEYSSHPKEEYSCHPKEEYSCHPKEKTITVTRRPSAVIKINSDESNERARTSSIKRQPSTVIRINDNETHSTIFNQKPTPKPRLSKENNG